MELEELGNRGTGEQGGKGQEPINRLLNSGEQGEQGEKVNREIKGNRGRRGTGRTRRIF